MKKLRISQIQFEAKSTPYQNSRILENLFKKSLNFKPNLICTPECSNIITNDLKHLFKNTTYINDCPITKMAKKFALQNNVYINLGSLLLKIKGQKKLVNRSIFINSKGIIKKFYDKIHMFDVNINKKEKHRESQSFKPGFKIAYDRINNIKIGFTICYDLRFPDLFRKLAKKGVEIILLPAAFTVPTGRDHWEILIKARAIENSLFVIATDMCGNHHKNRKTYGHSIICDPWGSIINKSKSKPAILNTEIDLSLIKKARSKIPATFL